MSHGNEIRRPDAASPAGLPAEVLLVDDDPLFRDEMRLLLEREGYRIEACGTIAQARRWLRRRRPLLVLLDIELPDGKGTAFLPEILSGAAAEDGAPAHEGDAAEDDAPAHQDPPREAALPEVVMVSGASSLQEAADSIKRGAADFLEKPFEPHRLLAIVHGATRIARLRRTNAGLLAEKLARYPLIGESQAMRALRHQVRGLAGHDARVLILGESGTGKENVAGQIHYRSARAEAPLVTINCAALPSELVESELFGHEQGAFTGADQARPGRFLQAHRGTLLLDEIGDLPLALQPKLLRAIETGQVTPVGGRGPVATDVRILSATHQNLPALLRSGRFREDLFYRIHTVPIEVPPLRARREDIGLLAEHFLNELAVRNASGGPRASAPGTPCAGETGVKALAPQALDRLLTHDWPGNVRELRNLIERLFYLAPGDRIDARDVEGALGQSWNAAAGTPWDAAAGARGEPGDDKHRLAQAVERFERDYLRAQLRAHEGNVTRLAGSLGMDRGNLYRKLKRLGLLSS